MKVSICIPAYRQIEYLRVTLGSVAAQTFTDYELVVTDDSPDDAVARLLAEFDWQGRLRYQRNESALGSPRNWNAAIEMSRGEYVKILHHDDAFASPDALARFVDLLDARPDAGFGFSASRVEDVLSGGFRINRASPEQLVRLRELPECLFWGNFIGAPSATIIRRAAWQPYALGMKWLVDVEHYMRLLSAGAGFAYCDEPLIVTPTNVDHQVTELCRTNGVVELGEYYRLFAQYRDALMGHDEARAVWKGLYLRYFLSAPEDFARFGLTTPEPREYFAHVAPVGQLLLRQAMNLAYHAACKWPLLGPAIRYCRRAYLRARGRTLKW